MLFSSIWGDKYIFTDHATQAMEKHKIGRDLVRRVLNKYDRSEPASYDSKFYIKNFKKHEIGVMAIKNAKGQGKVIVITVWKRELPPPRYSK